MGTRSTEAVTAATLVFRPNQVAEVEGKVVYGDARTRRALAMAVDNAICLELGYSNRGVVAENHHVCPIHPAYADIGAPTYDPAGAKALMEEAGMGDFEHELITVDDDFEIGLADNAVGHHRCRLNRGNLFEELFYLQPNLLDSLKIRSLNLNPQGGPHTALQHYNTGSNRLKPGSGGGSGNFCYLDNGIPDVVRLFDTLHWFL